MGRHGTIAGRKEAQDKKRAASFTKLVRLITVAARGGENPEFNVALKHAIEKAKAINMPNDNINRAIKKVAGTDGSNAFETLNYEGYGPSGIAIFVETATDNTTRTVAHLRSYFNKHGGSLGTTGSLEFLFDHKCVFHLVAKEGVDLEELALELIDFGVEDEIEEEDGELIVYGEFAQNAALQSYLEGAGFEISSVDFVRIPNDYRDVTAEEAEKVNKLIEKIEEDEDVQNVFTNMREPE